MPSPVHLHHLQFCLKREIQKRHKGMYTSMRDKPTQSPCMNVRNECRNVKMSTQTARQMVKKGVHSLSYLILCCLISSSISTFGASKAFKIIWMFDSHTSWIYKEERNTKNIDGMTGKDCRTTTPRVS